MHIGVLYVMLGLDVKEFSLQPLVPPTRACPSATCTLPARRNMPQDGVIPTAALNPRFSCQGG